MANAPTLQDFVDDELMRAPLLVEQVFEAVVVARGRQRPLTTMRGGGTDPARVLEQHRGDLVRSAMQSLRQQVAAELADAPPPAGPAAAPATPATPELSLLDDDAVAADIQVLRAVEAAKSSAEYELRELQAFTSALVGDLNVSRDTNPFRPEAWARALWDALQTLPLPRPAQAALMRDAGPMLGRELRQVYAAACTRLEGQGVTPGTHRTIVLTSRGTEAPDDLHELRDSMPMPLDEPPQPVAERMSQQTVELLSRLFEAILSDRSLPAGTQLLVSRLHPTALRLVLRDPTMLDGWEHPAWRFIDQLAQALGQNAPADQARAMALLQGLVDHLAGDAEPSAQRFRWALERLAVFEHHAFGQTLTAAARTIEHLRSLQPAGDGGAGADGSASRPLPLDMASLDTVPASLLASQGDDDAGAAAAVDATAAGAWLRVYLQARWQAVRLLWRGEAEGLWLLLEPSAPRYWALRRSAVEQLARAGLLRPVPARSLAREAAERLQQQLGSGHPAR